MRGTIARSRFPSTSAPNQTACVLTRRGLSMGLRDIDVGEVPRVGQAGLIITISRVAKPSDSTFHARRHALERRSPVQMLPVRAHRALRIAVDSRSCLEYTALHESTVRFRTYTGCGKVVSTAQSFRHSTRRFMSFRHAKEPLRGRICSPWPTLGQPDREFSFAVDLKTASIVGP